MLMKQRSVILLQISPLKHLHGLPYLQEKNKNINIDKSKVNVQVRVSCNYRYTVVLF